jgi:hypothetical protein
MQDDGEGEEPWKETIPLGVCGGFDRVSTKSRPWSSIQHFASSLFWAVTTSLLQQSNTESEPVLQRSAPGVVVPSDNHDEHDTGDHLRHGGGRWVSTSNILLVSSRLHECLNIQWREMPQWLNST